MWPDNRLINLFDIELPIIQAPMAGSAFWDLAVAVSEAGGLGSLACALLSVEQARKELETIRRKTSRPICVNFLWSCTRRLSASILVSRIRICSNVFAEQVRRSFPRRLQ